MRGLRSIIDGGRRITKFVLRFDFSIYEGEGVGRHTIYEGEGDGRHTDSLAFGPSAVSS